MGGPGAPGGQPPVAGARPPTPQDVASILAERRRAAREAEAAAAARNAGAAGPAAGHAAHGALDDGGSRVRCARRAPAPPAAVVDPQWNSVFQRYQQPRR